jgi:hypothetical protein
MMSMKFLLVSYPVGLGYINAAALVHVSDFRTSETELSAAKAVRVNRDLRPPRNFLFQPLHMLHVPKTSPLFSSMPGTVGRFSWPVSDGREGRPYPRPCRSRDQCPPQFRDRRYSRDGLLLHRRHVPKVEAAEHNGARDSEAPELHGPDPTLCRGCEFPES